MLRICINILRFGAYCSTNRSDSSWTATKAVSFLQIGVRCPIHTQSHTTCTHKTIEDNHPKQIPYTKSPTILFLIPKRAQKWMVDV
jgi:hypothetical protein